MDKEELAERIADAYNRRSDVFTLDGACFIGDRFSGNFSDGRYSISIIITVPDEIYRSPYAIPRILYDMGNEANTAYSNSDEESYLRLASELDTVSNGIFHEIKRANEMER